jgi:hypothetical protein
MSPKNLTSNNITALVAYGYSSSPTENYIVNTLAGIIYPPMSKVNR